MRLLHVISSANPSGGGPIEGIKQLSTIQLELGNRVELVTTDAPDSPWGRNLPFPVHALGPPHTHYHFSFNLLPWLRRHAPDYDAVIVNGLWQHGGFAVRRALAGLNTPYFVFTHGMLDPWFKRTYPLKHLKKWLYWPWGQYPVLRDAQAVFFTCEEERLLARQSFWLYRCNEVVVNYGTAAAPRDLASAKADFLMTHPDLRQKRLLLFLSRIHEKKGCDVLLRAFARVAADMPNLHLVMAGPDQTGWVSKLQSLGQELGIAQRVSWPGMLSGTLKWGAYAAADAFILPSHQENFGIVVAEAMACGVPVLISDKVNIWREIQADAAGIVAADDETGTLQLLRQWLSLDPAALARMGENAKRCFDQRFEIHRAAASLIEAISPYVRAGSQQRSPLPASAGSPLSH